MFDNEKCFGLFNPRHALTKKLSFNAENTKLRRAVWFTATLGDSVCNESLILILRRTLTKNGKF